MKAAMLMNQYYDQFTEQDKDIATCILRHPKDCIQMSIEEFALTHHFSKSSLSRFAQKVSLSGYGQLRSMLRMDTLQKKEAASTFLDAAIQNYHAMIEDMREKDHHSLFQRLDQAKRVLIFASGYTQARVASEWKRIFLPLHKVMYDMYGHDMAEPFLHMVKPDDLVILISLSGESKEVVMIAKELRLRQIASVSITRLKMNTLTQLCEENLYIHSLQIHQEYGVHYEITTPYFILIEMLYLKYQAYLHDEHIPVK